ncbi:MAG: sigma-70 family RNA polymerase sigma factor [Bryobacterales bacterium]|nr:sigma-70 family RNA polymerase sigma factor [Bryobacterales bacterium]
MPLLEALADSVGSDPSPRWEDRRLVEACLEGNAGAWGALVDKYKRLIYSIPFRYDASSEDADDIFQNVCIELHNELHKLRNVDALRSWLITVTSRQSLLWKKRMQRRGETSIDDGEQIAGWSAAEPEVERLERGQLVQDALGKIPERCRRMMEMLFFEDPPRPYDEVARELGLARGSIGFIRGRCLEKMQKALREAGF